MGPLVCFYILMHFFFVQVLGNVNHFWIYILHVLKYFTASICDRKLKNNLNIYQLRNVRLEWYMYKHGNVSSIYGWIKNKIQNNMHSVNLLKTKIKLSGKLSPQTSNYDEVGTNDWSYRTFWYRNPIGESTR